MSYQFVPYRPFFGPRRAPRRAPHRKNGQKKKRGPRLQREVGHRVTYSDRKLIQLEVSSPIQITTTLDQVLGNQGSEAPNWWSEFTINKLTYKINKVLVKGGGEPTSTVLFDFFPNLDSAQPSTSEEFLREQGKRTKVYVPGKTGNMFLRTFVPKYDATGSGNQYTRLNKLDVKTARGVHWNGLCIQADAQVSIELEQTAVITFYGAH